MAVSAFCPAYATGIFQIGDKDALGAGFTLDKGMTTTATQLKQGRTTTAINGMESPAPVSKSVLRRYSEECGKVGLLEIKHATEIPIGFGLGMSAAGALSLSLCLNELLGAGFSGEKCVKIAHDAEVECGTGLSGADAAAIGGLVARKNFDEPPVKISFEEKEMQLAFFSPIRTSTVIYSEGWKKKVNEAGRQSLDALFRNKGWDGFVECSRMFAEKSGLAEWCRDEMQQNKRASMAMLGQTLFSDLPMMLRRKANKIVSAKTNEMGARLI